MKKEKAIPNVRLQQARIDEGWTQETLADRLNVAAQTVGSWERGTRSPSPRIRSELCHVLGKTPEQLGLVDRAEQTAQGPSSTLDLPRDPAHPSLPATGLVARPPSASRELVDENRQRMLNRVHFRWIAGVLEQSLYKRALIVLGLVAQPDAVENPWRFAFLESTLPPRSLPEGTRITDAYDEADGELLILGEPGAGKTTLLLELTRDLLERARSDHHYPIPVVFNLASWTERRHPFAVWLVEELNQKYQVPHELGQQWVTTDQLLPLLDGLDEVAQTHRAACVEAINTYRQEHGLVRMVICSRSSDYLVQGARVLLRTAVVVQPLTDQQIEEFLSSAGEDLAAMRVALRQDPTLHDMARTPLMLSILALTYHGVSVEDALAVGTPLERRRIVFEKYVERVLGRSGTNRHYSAEQTKRWLAWLGSQLDWHSQTEFYIERLQPSWLSSGQSRQRYRHAIVLLIFGIQIFISSALFSWLRGGLKGSTFGVGVGLLGLLGAGPGNTTLGWMARGLGGGLEGGGSLGIIMSIGTVIVILLVRDPLPALSVRAFGRGLYTALRSGLVIGGGVGIFASLVFSLAYGLRDGLVRGVGTGLFSGLLIGMTSGLIAGLSYEREGSRERRHRPDQKQARASPSTRLFDVVIFSLCAALPFGGVYTLLADGITPTVVIFSLVVGFFYGLAFGVGGGTDLLPRLGAAIQPAETVAWSWHNVGRNLSQNLRRGLLVGLAVMLPVSVIIGCASWLFYGERYGVRYGLIFGLIVGVVGGVATILTSILRSGWSSRVLSEHQLFRPNEGTQRSLRNAVFAACLFGPLGGLACGLACGGAFWLVGGLPGWPILGVGFAIVFSVIFATQFLMIHGGIAFIEHYILRAYLWWGGYVPWNYVRFLNYAAERALLSKVGGGYMFSHRLLLEHFATLD